MHERARRVSACDDLGNRHQGADLVVCEADRHQGGAGIDRFERRPRESVHRGDRHVVAVCLQPAHRRQHGLMLGRPGDDARGFRQPARHAEDREVHGLGPRGGEGDVAAIGMQLLSDHVSRAVQRGAGGAAFSVHARGVRGGQAAERFDHLGQHRSSGGVVQIDPAHVTHQFAAGAALSRGCGPAAAADL